MASETGPEGRFWQGPKAYMLYILFLLVIGIIIAIMAKGIYYDVATYNKTHDSSFIHESIVEQVLSNLAAGLILTSLLSFLAWKFLFPDVKNADIQDQIKSVEVQIEGVRKEIADSKGEGLGTVYDSNDTIRQLNMAISSAKSEIFIVSYGVAIFNDENIPLGIAADLKLALTKAIRESKVKIKWFQVGDLISFGWYETLKELQNDPAKRFAVYFDYELSLQFPTSIILVDPGKEENFVIKIFYGKNVEKIPHYEINYGILFFRNQRFSEKVLKSIEGTYFNRSNLAGPDELPRRINELRNKSREDVKAYLYKTYKTLEIDKPVDKSDRKTEFLMAEDDIVNIATHLNIIDLDIICEAFIEKIKELASKEEGTIYFAYGEEANPDFFRKNYPNAIKICNAAARGNFVLVKMDKGKIKNTQNAIFLDIQTQGDMQKNTLDSDDYVSGVIYFISKKMKEKIINDAPTKGFHFAENLKLTLEIQFNNYNDPHEVEAMWIRPHGSNLDRKAIESKDLNLPYNRYKDVILKGYQKIHDEDSREYVSLKQILHPFDPEDKKIEHN